MQGVFAKPYLEETQDASKNTGYILWIVGRVKVGYSSIIKGLIPSYHSDQITSSRLFSSSTILSAELCLTW